MTRLSANFHLDAFTRSATADANGIEITVAPGSRVYRNLEALVIEILQPLRDHIAAPLYVTSGYRPPRVNRLVGGASDSQHTTGQATDVYADHHEPVELASHVVDLRLPFDQCIVEHDQGILHLSHKSEGCNRGETLTRYRSGDGEFEYVAGLVANPWDRPR